jgi:hypothetical protein
MERARKAFTLLKSPTKTHFEQIPFEEPRDSNPDVTIYDTPLFLRSDRYQRKQRRRVFVVVGIVLCALLVLSIAQFILVIAHLHTSAHRYEEPWNPLPCGLTPSTAAARGCHYSVILGDWLPPACYDAEMEAEYRSKSSFTFYYSNASGTGPDLTRPLKSYSELAELPYPIITWSTWRYHMEHCLWSWYYLHRAIVMGRQVSENVASLNHTMHCMRMVMLEDQDFQAVITGAISGTPACVDVEDYWGIHDHHGVHRAPWWDGGRGRIKDMANEAGFSGANHPPVYEHMEIPDNHDRNHVSVI